MRYATHNHIAGLPTIMFDQGSLQFERAADGGITIDYFGPRGGYRTSFETAFPAALITLLERVDRTTMLITEPLPIGDQHLVARHTSGSFIQLHTSRPDLPGWRRDTIGPPLIELPLAVLPELIALLRPLAPAHPRPRLRLV